MKERIVDDGRLQQMISGMKLYADLPCGTKINEFSAKDLYSVLVELKERRGIDKAKSSELESKLETAKKQIVDMKCCENCLYNGKIGCEWSYECHYPLFDHWEMKWR